MTIESQYRMGRRGRHPFTAVAMVASVTLCAATASAAPPTEQLVAQHLGLTHFTIQTLRPSIAGSRVTLPLDLEGRRVTLRLEPASLRSPDFKVLAQQPDGELREVAPPASATYRGLIVELPGATVAGSIQRGRLNLAIALGDGRMFAIQPLAELDSTAGAAMHVVYLDDVAAAPGTCATRETAQLVAHRPGYEERSILAGPLVADLALDCDYELYLLDGSSIDATVLDVENILSGVNLVYNRDCGIQHRLVRIIVRSSEPDPYSTTDPDSLLNQFRDHWNASQTGLSRDVAHFMTGKNIDGGTIGIASVGVVCNKSRAYGLSQTRFTTNLSRRIALTAHELGHQWNADHCDGASPCNIMCSSLDGCDGIGLPNFEPLGATAIKNFAASRTCLDSPTTAVDAVSTSSRVRFAAPRPSPFHRETRLSYYLGEPGPVRLEIYDIAGKRVVTLFSGDEGAGWHTHAWDGASQNGARLGSGIFHARLSAQGTSQAQKLIRIE